MIKFTGKFKSIKFNRGGWSRARETAIETQIRQAARIWLRTIRDSVPVWSGQLQGSLLLAQGANGGLAEYLGVSESLTQTPQHSRPLKNPLTGALLAHYSFPTGQHKFGFRYVNDIDYFLYNDENPRAANIKQQIDAPWRARLKANTAFNEYLTQIGINKIPGIKSAIVFTEDYSL